MPELPEVTVIVNSLNKTLKGLTLKSVETDWPRKFYWGKFSSKDIVGLKVQELRRMGKVVIIDLGKLAIIIHLKLTGQLIYQDKKTRIGGGHPIPPLNLPVPNKTTRATFEFTNGGHLYFNDIRKFGWIKVIDGNDESIKEAIGELGPDPMKMTPKEFIDRTRAIKDRRPQIRIKKLLMEQTFVSGVGNIYSDEALWRAKINPKRFLGSLSDSDLKAIFKGLIESFELAIAKGGSSANSFVDGRGEKGLYLTFANAYHMTGKPCKRCKTLIVREKLDGRSAHWCPNCQKLS